MKVVLIHGMFCGTGFWRPVEALLQERGVESLTVRLHPDGASKAGRGFDEITASVEAPVQAQLQALAGQPTVLVGHSLGALVVEKILPRFPQAAAILVNPSPGWGSLGPVYPLWLAARRGRFWQGLVRLSPHESRRLLCQGMSDAEFAAALDVVEPESGELVRQAFWFFDLLGKATRIERAPDRDVTLLTGDRDPMATATYCKRLVSRYGPGSRLDVIEGAGHWLPLQKAGSRALVQQITAILGTQAVSNL